MSEPDPTGDLDKADAGMELDSLRTSFSFEQTRMGSDRTLMSVVRTSLSLISFGFTIYQVLGKASAILPKASVMARNVGLGLLILGLANLVMGLISHGSFDRGLMKRRDSLLARGLLRDEAQYQARPTYLVAFALMAIGVLALATIVFRLMD